MRLDARATRGGPVPARVVLGLFCLSLTVLFGFGPAGNPEIDPGEISAVGEEPAALSLELARAVEPFGLAEPSVVAAFALDVPVRALASHGPLEDILHPHDSAEIGFYSSVAEPADEVIEGELKRGQTLSSALSSHGVRTSTIHAISSELLPLFDFHRAQPGQIYRLVIDSKGRLLEFDYQIDPGEGIHLARTQDGSYQAVYDKSELVPHVVRLAGVVNSTLYAAVESLGEEPSLASTVAAVFAWEFDFTRSARPGDQFQILYERLYRETRDGGQHYVRPGRILAARYSTSAGRELEVLYFETPDGRGGYYRPDGTSIERQFLAAPLEYSRISSPYSNARRHPILKVTRAHHGIDYAAPHGTPLWAVAEGTVIHRSRAGGFGRLVKVRHNNGYVSYYAHLSHYASNLRVGQKVEQKQVLGYVGSSGLATGPHVCFRVSRNGRYLNPSDIETPPADPIALTDWPAFAEIRDRAMLRLDAATVVALRGAP